MLPSRSKLTAGFVDADNRPIQDATGKHRDLATVLEDVLSTSEPRLLCRRQPSAGASLRRFGLDVASIKRSKRTQAACTSRIRAASGDQSRQ
jgi:hypothetical protein